MISRLPKFGLGSEPSHKHIKLGFGIWHTSKPAWPRDCLCTMLALHSGVFFIEHKTLKPAFFGQ